VRKYIEQMAAFTGLILSPLLHYRLRIRLALLADTIFTYANRRHFRAIGQGARVARNVTLVSPHCISLGTRTTIGAHSVVTAWTDYHGQCFNPTIEIGDNTSIGAYCHLTAVERITIGRGVLFGMNVTVSDNAHGASETSQLSTSPIQRPLVAKGPIEIGDNVWIGSKATILSGVRIGAGAIVAANAVVVNDVPDSTIVAGIPARPVKEMRE
jgi:acetyltransferase-like isoleucine patch superfamily enzyme